MSSEILTRVIVECDASEEEIQGFLELYKLIAPNIFESNNHKYLKEIWIVDDQQVANKVNFLKEINNDISAPYEPGSEGIKAVALPLEQDGKLECYIIIEKSRLSNLSTAGFPLEIVSTLLEELIHVDLYASAKRRRGSFRIPATSLYENDLHVTCSMMMDEYIVTRRKIPIIYALFKEAEIWYGGDVASLVSSAGIEVEKEHNKPYLLNITYRLLLEPLSRNAAFVYVNQQFGRVKEDLSKPSDSQYYNKVFITYWTLIKEHLEKACINDSERDKRLFEIVKIVKDFLETFKKV